MKIDHITLDVLSAVWVRCEGVTKNEFMVSSDNDFYIDEVDDSTSCQGLSESQIANLIESGHQRDQNVTVRETRLTVMSV